MRWILLFSAAAASLFGQVSTGPVSIGHIHLMVADPEEQKKLWVGLLGAEIIKVGSLEALKFPGVFMIVGKARTPPAEGSDGSTVNHIGFLVPSYKEIKAKLEARSITFAMDNVANKQAHVLGTGPEIWEQTNGQVDGFICALGSGGTLAGVAEALRARNPRVTIGIAT